MDILNILEQPHYDESIESFQYYDYAPASQENLNKAGAIHIDINASDVYILPSKSEILIKGELVRADNNNPFDANTEIALVNNAMLYLFSEVKYSIGGTVVERISNPGQITSMFGYLSQPDDYNTSAGLGACWSKDTTDNANSTKFQSSQAAPGAGYTPTENPNFNQGFSARKALLMSANPAGCFSFLIKFEHIFGFVNYEKVVYNMKHTLTLTRDVNDILPIHKAQNVGNAKIKLNNITWRMPHVKPEISYLVKLRDIVVNKSPIPIAFSARQSDSTNVPQGVRNHEYKLSLGGGIEKPRWVIVGFQTDRSTTQFQNPSVFDHVNLSRVYVNLNGERHPINDFEIDFDRNDYAILYWMLDSFKREHYGFNSLVGGTQVNYLTFKTLFPIIVLDVRHQSERLRSGIVDMTLKFSFKQPIPQHTVLYVSTISDREYSLKSDGNNLTLISK